MKMFEKLFRPTLVAENGEAIPFIWVGDDHRAVCMNPDSTTVFASVWHDGYGKFYPTIYASLFAAFRIRSREPVVNCKLHSFPRCGLELLRFVSPSMVDAQEDIEAFLAEVQMI